MVVLHGGPGALGEMRPVAEQLHPRGVLEPLLTSLTMESQLHDLEEIIRSAASTPVCIIGFSWGAWLAALFAAAQPDLCRKLVLIGCPPLEEKYAAAVQKNRMQRLSEPERQEFKSLSVNLDAANSRRRFFQLLHKTDTVQPVEDKTFIDFRLDVFQKIWPRAKELRRSGKLVKSLENITCPITAIHGKADPHPREGLMIFKQFIANFTLHILPNCGHKPWIENEARDAFFQLLKRECRI